MEPGDGLFATGWEFYGGVLMASTGEHYSIPVTRLIRWTVFVLLHSGGLTGSDSDSVMIRQGGPSENQILLELITNRLSL